MLLLLGLIGAFLCLAYGDITVKLFGLLVFGAATAATAETRLNRLADAAKAIEKRLEDISKRLDNLSSLETTFADGMRAIQTRLDELES